MRNDIQGRRAPAWLQAILTGRYGRTAHGEPRYRLVWAPARRERSGGVWCDWEDGQIVRREPEVRWVEKYPGETCWLIERWTPAASYGTPEDWYAQTRLATPRGVIAALGDYPTFGEYEDIGARMHWYPSERHLTLAVDAVERRRQQMPATPLGRALRRTRQAQQEQEKRDREYEQFAGDIFDDSAPAFAGAPMIGYGGSHRPALVEMAEKAGIRQHPL